MKNTLLLFSFVVMGIFAFGQTPQGINYQTVIRDGDGQPIVNTAITLKMSIRAEAANGTIVYSETHTKVSNSFGLVNLIIGQGTPVEGEFSAINWGANTHFLETAIDTDGNGNFQVLGVTQFLSVPYALYSEKTGDTTIWQKNEDVVYYNRGQVGVGTGEPDNSALLEVKSTEKGLLPPRMTHAEINAIVEPANGLTVFCTDCGVDGNGAFFGFINGAWNSILTCIPPATPTAGTLIPLENQITWNWNAVPGANGYKWNSSGTYSTATDMGTATTKTETGLSCNTLYSRYVWSYNTCGISAPIKLEQATDNNSPVSPTAGTQVASLNEIVWNWNTVSGATGYKWNFTNQFASAEDLGTLTTKTETGLDCDTEFTRFVWSYNDCGNSEVTILTQSTTLNPAVGVSIAASANPVCAGIPITFTATPVNGGTEPVYQWTLNGTIIPDEINATYTYVPLNSDAISCLLTSNIPCSPNNPATSNTVTMTVNPILPVSITIAPNLNPTCIGSSVTFTATPTNGGTTPVFLWKKNGANVGTNSPTYSFVPANGNVVTCVLTSNATCNSGSPATSNAVTMTVNPLLPVSVSISTPSNLVCNGASATFTAVPTNGGTSPAYQWKVNGINKGTNSPTYSYAPVNGDLVKCALTSNAPCKSGSPATSNTIAMVVNPLLPVSVSVAASANPVCVGTSVTFTATPANGGTTPVYQWKLNGNVAGTNSPTYTCIPANSDVITCILTSNEACNSGNPATSEPFTMTVNPLQPVSVSIAPSVNPVCEGSSVTFTATPTNGGTAPAYQWKVNGSSAGTNSPTFAYIPVNGDVVTCILTSNANCSPGNPAIANSVTMTVNSLLIAPTAGTHVPYDTQIIWKWNTVSGANGYKWNTINDYATATDMGISTTKTETGLACNTSYVRYTWAYNACGYSPTTSLNINTYSCGTPCSGTPTILYGDHIYNTIQIGTQCWMKENLNIGNVIMSTQDQNNNGIIEKYCYNNSEYYCNIYGGLYQWYEMMQYSNTEGVRGICPAGWRLPTHAEWTALSDFLGGYNVAGGKLKEDGTTHWNSPNIGATNSSGFTSFGGGQRYFDYSGIFFGIGNHGFFWTSTKSPSSWVYHMMLSSGGTGFYSEPYETTLGLSVRCLKGEPTSTQISVLPTNQSVSSNSGSSTFAVTSNTSWNISKNVSWLSLSKYYGANNDPINVTFNENTSTNSRIGQILITPFTGSPTITLTITQAGKTQWSCGQSFIDSRDNKSYNTVLIDEQCWMKENLNTGILISGTNEQTNNNIVEKYCYNNMESNCVVYGGLYQWNEMMQFSTTEGDQGICPSGWHLPTKVEWTTLSNYLGGETVAGGKIKETGTLHWFSPNIGATNSSGFTALPSGVCGPDGYFYTLGSWASFWLSSSEYNGSIPWEGYLTNTGVEFNLTTGSDKSTGFSVRCIKDN